MLVLKSGYRVEVTSWENDGDHYATEVWEGMTKLEATVLAKYCIKCTSADAPYGLLEELCKEYGFPYNTEDSIFHEEVHNDMIGHQYESDYSRIVNSVEVFCIPSTIEFEQVDLC